MTYTTLTNTYTTRFATAATEANALDEARDVFRSAVQELEARAAALGIPLLIREKARYAAEDVLTDLFYEKERELQQELDEDA